MAAGGPTYVNGVLVTPQETPAPQPKVAKPVTGKAPAK